QLQHSSLNPANASKRVNLATVSATSIALQHRELALRTSGAALYGATNSGVPHASKLTHCCLKILLEWADFEFHRPCAWILIRNMPVGLRDSLWFEKIPFPQGRL